MRPVTVSVSPLPRRGVIDVPDRCKVALAPVDEQDHD
jgi:hypothetical protein